MVGALEFEKKYYTFIYSLKTIPIYIFESTKKYTHNTPIHERVRRGRDPIVVGFTTTYAIGAYHH